MDMHLNKIASLIKQADHLFDAYINNRQRYVEADFINKGENEIMPKIKGGSIRKRANNLYELRYYENNKQKSIYGRNLKDLIKRFTKIKKELKQKQKEPVKYYTYKGWLNEWYYTYKKPNLKENSLYNIKNSINKYILPYFKDNKLADISPLEIQKFLNTINAYRAKEMVVNVLKDSFNVAMINNLIDSNPITKLKFKRTAPNKKKAFTTKQLKTVLLNINDINYKQLIKFYLLTGCRRTEALSIEWSDINLNKRELHIKGTKTKKSNRVLPINNELLKLLQQINKTNSSYLFNFEATIVSNRFRRILKKLDYKNLSLHSLRHTFATSCLEQGIPIKVVQEWLGHSSYQITADTYTHITKDYNKKSADKLKFESYMH